MLELSDNELYALAGKTVRSIASKQFAGFFRADDIDQLTIDVATKAWQSRDRYEKALGTEGAWVWKIARNAILDAYAAEKRYRGLFSPVSLEERVDEDGEAVGFTPVAETETDARLIAEETKQTLRSCISDERDERLFDGLAAGLGSAELAKREGVPASDIYTPVSRLRSRLREHLDSAA